MFRKVGRNFTLCCASFSCKERMLQRAGCITWNQLLTCLLGTQYWVKQSPAGALFTMGNVPLLWMSANSVHSWNCCWKNLNWLFTQKMQGCRFKFFHGSYKSRWHKTFASSSQPSQWSSSLKCSSPIDKPLILQCVNVPKLWAPLQLSINQTVIGQWPLNVQWLLHHWKTYFILPKQFTFLCYLDRILFISPWMCL